MTYINMDFKEDSTSTKKSIPKNWIKTTLGTAFKWGSGGTPLRSESVYYNGSIPWVIIGDMNDDNIYKTKTNITVDGLKNSSARWVEPDSVLMAMYGSIGKLAIAKIKLTTNQAIAFTNPKPIHSKYLFYYLMHERQNFMSLGSGATQLNISQTKIKSYPFLLAPLPEQERIVAKIETLFSELDAGVQALKRAEANLKRYKASVLKAACEGSLVPTEAELARQEGRDYEPANVLLKRILRERRIQWESKTWQGLVEKAKQKATLLIRKDKGQSARVSDLAEHEWMNLLEAEYQKYLPKDETWKQKYPEPAAPDISTLPELPEGWVWASVDYLTETIGGVTKGKNLSGKKIVSLPYLRVANVQRSYLNLEEIKKIDVEEADLNKYRLRKGDLLLTEGGDADKLGRSAIWNDEIENCIHQNHIFRARPIDNLIDSKWLMIITNSEFGRSYFLESSKQTTNLASINLTQLRSCPIPLPPLLEQNRIINEYERILSLEMEINNSINFDLIRAERLRQSILKRAFEGKLVPQDPNDEPASELLKRIQTQKETGSVP